MKIFERCPATGSADRTLAAAQAGPSVRLRNATQAACQRRARVRCVQPSHHHGFEGTGSVAIDTIAGSNATLVGATLDGSGNLTLDGGGAYVDLPNRLLSASNDHSIETWLTWRGGRAWQRIFDFGSSDAGEGQPGNGRTSLYLTPRSADDAIVLAFSARGHAGETRSSAALAFPVDTLVHVAVVVDSPSDSLSLYLDGRSIATQTLAQRLSEIDDVNCWLGMAQSERGIPA